MRWHQITGALGGKGSKNGALLLLFDLLSVGFPEGTGAYPDEDEAILPETFEPDCDARAALTVLREALARFALRLEAGVVVAACEEDLPREGSVNWVPCPLTVTLSDRRLLAGGSSSNISPFVPERVFRPFGSMIADFDADGGGTEVGASEAIANSWRVPSRSSVHSTSSDERPEGGWSDDLNIALTIPITSSS